MVCICIVVVCICGIDFRTDIPEDEFIRVTVHTMMAACTYYAGGFIWGAEDNRDYMPELIRLKEMIINYATASV